MLGAKKWDALDHGHRGALRVGAHGRRLCTVLWLLETPPLNAISLQTQEEREWATASRRLRCRLPPLLLLKAASGVLVGYQRIRVASVVNASLAGVDALAFYLVLHPLRLDLRDAGVASTGDARLSPRCWRSPSCCVASPRPPRARCASARASGRRAESRS